MTFFLFCIVLVLSKGTLVAQNFYSIHQEEYNYYNSKSISPQAYEAANKAQLTLRTKSVKNCTLNKVVFGWHPYWMNGLEANYDWNLLSHLSYFGYSVNPNTGNAYSTYNWETAAVVDSALANGVSVNLCITLFSDHATFFGNSTAQQTLISNLINLVQLRNAHGVNIDFEAVPFSQKTALTNFVIDLSTQMKAAIPNAHISIALPAVDWSGTFDVAAMLPHIDLFLIMGYDYYWGNSTQAGPTDPLYTHVPSYDRNVSRSITYYLNEGIPESKLALGLPYYGREWETVSNAIPSNTTGNYNGSRMYKVIRDNADGYYSNPVYYHRSKSTYHVYQLGGAWRQCFINDAHTLGKRYDMVNRRQLAGIGIWALGYDDGYSELWDLIENKFTNCAVVPCQDTIYDLGGPYGNYYPNERLTYTIAPTGANNLSLTFNSFNLAAGDTLRLFNGVDTAAPLIGSYTAAFSPGQIISAGHAITLDFASGSGATASGWEAFWECDIDTIPPTTDINLTANWYKENFDLSFTDEDNIGGSGIGRRFYQVSDFNGVEWSANTDRGFFFDGFTSLDTLLWTAPVGGGTWQITNNHLHQTDDAVNNTNIFAPLNQMLSNRYMYHFRAKIEGTYANQRFGFHFFADSAHYENRMNSYFVWFRQATDALEFYKVSQDTFSLEKIISDVSTQTGQWYDIKVVYDRITGEIKVYRDNVFLGSYTDPNPYSTGGNYISFRSGNCELFIDSLNVYRTRFPTATILVGADPANDIRYENTDTHTAAGKIKSIVSDNAGNLSDVAYAYVHVDLTPPDDISWVNDGLGADIDTVYTVDVLSANWVASADNISGVESYWYAIGTAPGDTSVVNWTNNGLNLSVSHGGLNIINGTTYFFSVKARDNAGHYSNVASSSGQTAVVAITVTADFMWSENNICSGAQVTFNNSSYNATQVEWLFQGGTPSYSTAQNPVVTYDTPGIFMVQLIASNSGVADTMSMPALINVFQSTYAQFTAPDTTYLPNAYAPFSNTSLYANAYEWDFGDGNTSTDFSPWHIYAQEGVYEVSLVASNSYCADTTLRTINVVQAAGMALVQEEDAIFIYPNPFTEFIKIEFCENKTVDVRIYDSRGRLVMAINEFRTGALNLHSLNSGVYVMKINDRSHLKTTVIYKL